MKVLTRVRKTAFPFLLGTIFVFFLALFKGDADINSLAFRGVNEVLADQLPITLPGDVLGSNGKVPVPFGQRTEFPPRHISKRAKEPLDEATAKQNGDDLLCLLTKSVNDAPQSKYTDYSALSAWGWVGNPRYQPIFDEDFDPILEALGEDGGVDPANNRPFGLDQKQLVTVGANTYPPSGGFYNQVYNFLGTEGAIVADANENPTYSSPKLGIWVPLRQWSDVTFLQWQNMAGSAIKNLKYIIRATISNPDTQNMIDVVFAMPGNNAVAWENRLTFNMDTDAGKILLGTPNGKGVAWLLINHKGDTQFGVKTVTSVTVWVDDPTEPKARWERSMFFTLDDVAS